MEADVTLLHHELHFLPSACPGTGHNSSSRNKSPNESDADINLNQVPAFRDENDNGDELISQDKHSVLWLGKLKYHVHSENNEVIFGNESADQEKSYIPAGNKSILLNQTKCPVDSTSNDIITKANVNESVKSNDGKADAICLDETKAFKMDSSDRLKELMDEKFQVYSDIVSMETAKHEADISEPYISEISDKFKLLENMIGELNVFNGVNEIRADKIDHDLSRIIDTKASEIDQEMSRIIHSKSSKIDQDISGESNDTKSSEINQEIPGEMDGKVMAKDLEMFIRSRKRKQTRPRSVSESHNEDPADITDDNSVTTSPADMCVEITQRPLCSKLCVTKKRRYSNRLEDRVTTLSRKDIIDIINNSLRNSNMPCTTNRYRRHFLRQLQKANLKRDKVSPQNEQDLIEAKDSINESTEREQTLLSDIENVDEIVLEGRTLTLKEMTGCDDEGSLACKVCLKHFTTIGMLSAHYICHSAFEKEQTCAQNGSTISDCFVSESHVTKVSNVKEFSNVINITEDTMETVESFGDDINEDGDDSESECMENEQSGSKEKHGDNILESSTYFCHLCQERFTNITSLQNHMHEHSAEESGEISTDGKGDNYCDICQKKFASAGSLHVHNKIHTGDNPYMCMTCNKSFRDKTRLTTHIRVHTALSGTQLDIRSITPIPHTKELQQTTLKISNQKYGEKPFICSVCQKSFSQKGNLKLHQKIHTGERNCLCGVCGNGFRSRSDLVRHMKVHGASLSSGSENEETNHKSSHNVSTPILRSHQEPHDSRTTKPHLRSNKIKDLLEANDTISPMIAIQGIKTLSDLHAIGQTNTHDIRISHGIPDNYSIPYKSDMYKSIETRPMMVRSKFPDYDPNSYLMNLNKEVEFIKAMTDAKLRTKNTSVKGYSCPLCGLILSSFDTFNHHILLQHNPLNTFGPPSTPLTKHPSILSLIDPFMSLPKNDTFSCKDCNEVFTSYDSLMVHVKSHRQKLAGMVHTKTRRLHSDDRDEGMVHTKTQRLHSEDRDAGMVHTKAHRLHSNETPMKNSDRFSHSNIYRQNYADESSVHTKINRTVYYDDFRQTNRPALSDDHTESNGPREAEHLNTRTKPKRPTDLDSLSMFVDTKEPVLSRGNGVVVGDTRTHRQPTVDPKLSVLRRDNGIGSFITSSAMMEDLKFSSSEKLYSCDFCSKTFRRSHHLQTHMRTHTGDRPYTCLECNKCFARGDHLQNHRRTHTGEKPYTCGICEKSYSQSHHLLRHKRTHTGERPYQCSQCDKTFSRDHHLKKHLETHMLTDKHLENHMLTDKHLENHMLTDKHLENHMLTDKHLENHMLTDNQQCKTNPRVQHIPRLPVIPFNMVTRSSDRISQLMMGMQTENSASKLMESMIKRHLLEEEERKQSKPPEEMDAQPNIDEIVDGGVVDVKNKEETLKITDLLNDEIYKRMPSQISADLILDHVMQITRTPKTSFWNTTHTSTTSPERQASLNNSNLQDGVNVKNSVFDLDDSPREIIGVKRHTPELTRNNVAEHIEHCLKAGLESNKTNTVSDISELKTVSDISEPKTLEDIVHRRLLEEYS